MSSENEDVRENTREAAGESGDLRERVRRLVLEAVVHRKADPKAIREVMQDVVEGLGEGLGGHAETAGESLKRAVSGLDEAMTKSLYAMQLAVEETWDKGKRFAESDLREAYDAVRDLENDLVGTLRRTGERARGTLKDEFILMSEHLARSGSDTGAQTKLVLQALRRDMGVAAGGVVRDVGADAREASGRLSAMTSGILRGLADALDGRKP
jgi:phosphoenolpyruvate-protein kinase (PTS system EI component)